MLPFRIRSRISGTDAIRVGLRTLASPCDPFLILDDRSLNVKAELYPTLAPFANMQFSAISSRMCASGKKAI